MRQAISPSLPTDTCFINRDGLVTEGLIQEIPKLDGADILTCHDCAMAMESLQSREDVGKLLARALDHLSGLDHERNVAGALGWTALSCAIHHTCEKISEVALKPLVQRYLDCLDGSTCLDMLSKQRLRSPFKSLIHGSVSLAKINSRRCSGASNDTGYASMSDDNNDMQSEAEELTT